MHDAGPNPYEPSYGEGSPRNLPKNRLRLYVAIATWGLMIVPTMIAIYLRGTSLLPIGQSLLPVIVYPTLTAVATACAYRFSVTSWLCAACCACISFSTLQEVIYWTNEIGPKVLRYEWEILAWAIIFGIAAVLYAFLGFRFLGWIARKVFGGRHRSAVETQT